MARHKYRKTNNNRHQDNNFEYVVIHNENHNHHNNNNTDDNADQTNNNLGNKATNCNNTTTVAQVTKNVNIYSATTNNSERYDTQRSEESNIAQEKMESLPMIAINDHVVSFDNSQRKHSNENNACVDNNEITDDIKETNVKNECKIPMQSAETKQAMNTASINTTANDATETTQNDVINNPQQTSEQIECTLQISEEEASDSCEKESLTIASDGNVVQENESDKNNTDNNLKHINNSEVNGNSVDTKSINEAPTIPNITSKVNLMNKKPSTLEYTQKESNTESQKAFTTITSSSSQEVDLSPWANTIMSTDTINDNSASTSASSVDVRNDANSVNAQLESPCECNGVQNNKNGSNNYKQYNKDARNYVKNKENDTTQNDFTEIHKSDDENESSGNKRCTLIDVKAAMAMKPRKSALRVNSPSFSQNCVMDDNNRNENYIYSVNDGNKNKNKNNNNNNNNNGCCNINEYSSNNQSINSSSAFSLSQVQSNGIGNNNNSSMSSSSTGNNNMSDNKNNNSKDDSARSRRRIRFCDPVVTFQDDGTYSHYYSSHSNVKQRPSQSYELQENQSNAKNEWNSDIHNNEHYTDDSYVAKKAINNSSNSGKYNSDYNVAAKHGKEEKETKESNFSAKQCPISDNAKELCKQEQQIHHSHEEDRVRSSNGSNYVNGVSTTNKNDTKRINKSHTYSDSISKTENSEINTTNNLNSSTDVGSYNGKCSSSSSVKHFVTLPHNRLSAAAFAMLRERTITHVQKM